MPALGAIIAWVMSNPAIIGAGVTAVQDVIQLVTSAFNLNKAGVMTDAQLAAVWAAVGVDVQSADDAWAAAKTAHAASVGAP